MKNGSKTLLFPVLCVLIALFLTSCKDDPEKNRLEFGANIDYSMMSGEITGKSILAYKGDQEWTKELAGKTYYALTVKQGSNNSETLVNVPEAVYNTVSIGTILPINPIMTPRMLTEVRGQIIDKFIDPNTRSWNVVFWDFGEQFTIYRVDRSLYYKKIEKGMRLPIDPDPVVPISN